jgi:integrase
MSDVVVGNDEIVSCLVPPASQLTRMALSKFQWSTVPHSRRDPTSTSMRVISSRVMARRLAWVHPDQAKVRRAIAVPLNADALALVQKATREARDARVQLQGQADHPGQHQGLVRSTGTADIRDFRWHDLRHTWASWHVQNGTPLFALQELGGWESAEMVRRYAHLAADHLAPYAERFVHDACDGA